MSGAPLRWKLVVFTLGAAFGMVGIAADSRTLRWIGIGTLLGGILLRLAFRRAGASPVGPNSYPDAPDSPPSLEDDAP